MSIVIVTLDQTAAIFTDPKSEEAEFQNLLLNLMGGLPLSDLSDEEKTLLTKYGYKEKF